MANNSSQGLLARKALLIAILFITSLVRRLDQRFSNIFAWNFITNFITTNDLITKKITVTGYLNTATLVLRIVSISGKKYKQADTSSRDSNAFLQYTNLRQSII